jgi:predicted HNH restriction endonuclease
MERSGKKGLSMGRHIYIDIHLVPQQHAYILADPQATAGTAEQATQDEYDRLFESSFAVYEAARRELETFTEKEENGGWEGCFDWTSFTDHQAIWSLALPKKEPMNMPLLLFVEDMRARKVIFGYTVYESGA